MRNTIALQKGLVLVPAPSGAASGDNAALAASLQAELMNLGFMFDAAAFAAARAAPREWLVAYHDEILPHLRQRLGAGHAHRPFYVNFPRQVMEADAFDLFFNAVLHYWSNGRWEPPQELERRGVRFENTDFKVLRPATEDEFRGVFTRLVSMNQSITEADKQALSWFVDWYGASLELPATIPFKETLCLLAAKGLDVPVKTPTDVLRIAVYLSGGDVSLPGVPKPIPQKKPAEKSKKKKLTFLPDWLWSDQSWWVREYRKAQAEARKKFRFRKFKRAERRRLLGMLEKTGADVADMQRHLGRWLRLGEVLHPSEFAARYPRTAESFRLLRNQHDAKTRVRTFPARVDLAFRRNWHTGVAMLAERPGEFARRLDWLLRTRDPAYVLDAFERAADGVSSKVLFELYIHFAGRIREAPRVVMIKGQRSKMKTLPPLPAMDRDRIQRVGNLVLRVLRGRIAALPPMGKVWIDERLKRVPVPAAMRSVNAAVKTYVRGTRVPFRPDAKVVRAFIHWFDENGSQDIDLSVAVFDEGMRMTRHLSFTNLRDSQLNCCHSGDIRHRKGACAEYVDLDVGRCLANGVRYAAIQCHNYNARPMHTVKDCVFGVMEREHAEANEIFVPKTISNCMPLANQGTSVVACVVDLVERNYVWADIESDRTLATVENTAGRTSEVLAALVGEPKLSVYDLLTMHATQRGSVVSDPAGADVVLRWEDLVTDYAKVAGYMAV